VSCVNTQTSRWRRFTRKGSGSRLLWPVTSLHQVSGIQERSSFAFSDSSVSAIYSTRLCSFSMMKVRAFSSEKSWLVVFILIARQIRNSVGRWLAKNRHKNG
jgi:hypothetical protein